MVASLVRKKRKYRIELYDSLMQEFALLEVDGIPIVIPGFENVDCFYYKEEGTPVCYVLTSTKTGRWICSSAKLKNIVSNAVDAFKRHGVSAKDADDAITEYCETHYGGLDAQTCDLNLKRKGSLQYVRKIAR